MPPESPYAPIKGKGDRNFGRPRISRHQLHFTLPSTPHLGSGFQQLPPPTGPAPYHLDLGDVVSETALHAIKTSKRLVFHIAGDTGGIKNAMAQRLVVTGMERDFSHDPPQYPQDPAFFYLLGDCVYYNGQAQEYYPQFYLPYEHYQAPIFAIPGNHDGDKVPPETSLEAFVRNFCAPTPVTSPDAGEDPRHTMTQPNVFWTLTTPLATMIGLYSNVPEHGVIHPDQQSWLVGELRAAPKTLPVFVALHHPVYSADDHHSGSPAMRTALENAARDAGRRPDIVFAGHVHNYQCFTRTIQEKQFPYIVAGAGGYYHLHSIASVNGQKIIAPVTLQQDGDTVTLEHYVDDDHGFLRVEVTEERIIGKYYTVPRPQEPFSLPNRLADFFQFDFRHHKWLPNTP